MIKSCHCGVAHPEVVGELDGLWIWGVVADTLNKKSQTADKGSPPALGLGRGLTTHHHKK